MHRRGKKGHLLLLHPPPCCKSRNSPRGRSGPGKSERRQRQRRKWKRQRAGRGDWQRRRSNVQREIRNPLPPTSPCRSLRSPCKCGRRKPKRDPTTSFFFKRLSIAELAQKSHCKYPYDTIRANFQSQRTPSAYFPSSDGSTNCESPMSFPRPTADQGAEGGEMNEPAVTPAPTVRASRWQHKRREVNSNLGTRERAPSSDENLCPVGGGGFGGCDEVFLVGVASLPSPPPPPPLATAPFSVSAPPPPAPSSFPPPLAFLLFKRGPPPPNPGEGEEAAAVGVWVDGGVARLLLLLHPPRGRQVDRERRRWGEGGADASKVERKERKVG